MIEGYGGILQSDGYGAYEAYAKEHPEVIWVACWAHARRKFFEAEAENPKAVRFVLRIISWLYEAEARWDEHALTPAQRRTHRQRLLYPPALLAEESGVRLAGAGTAEVRAGQSV